MQKGHYFCRTGYRLSTYFSTLFRITGLFCDWLKYLLVRMQKGHYFCRTGYRPSTYFSTLFRITGLFCDWLKYQYVCTKVIISVSPAFQETGVRNQAPTQKIDCQLKCPIKAKTSLSLQFHTQWGEFVSVGALYF